MMAYLHGAAPKKTFAEYLDSIGLGERKTLRRAVSSREAKEYGLQVYEKLKAEGKIQ